MTIRISYDGNDIDLLVGNSGLIVNDMQDFKQNSSASGKIEQINKFGRDELTFQCHFKRETYRLLHAWWWNWAREGNEFSFSMDSSNVTNTTLDGATTGATVPLTATTGLSVGDECMIIAAGDNGREIVVIDSISAGVSITAEDSLLFSFASGDVFRHTEYFPALINTDKSFKPIKNGEFYTHTFKWVEAL